MKFFLLSSTVTNHSILVLFLCNSLVVQSIYAISSAFATNKLLFSEVISEVKVPFEFIRAIISLSFSILSAN